jgi:LppP/LprE lipoprotein
VAVVHAHGFTPNDTSEYHPDQTLRVLVGTRTGSGDGYGQQAFFFLGGHYLGTDAKEPSAKLKVVSQGDTEVAISYPLYRRNDPLCCPSGGQRTVHFVLNDGKLTALDPIPPASGFANLSRY